MGHTRIGVGQVPAEKGHAQAAQRNKARLHPPSGQAFAPQGADGHAYVTAVILTPCIEVTKEVDCDISKSGDTVTLHLPMDVRLVKANPLVEELRGQVAVMRGPLLYCLESADLPDGGSLVVAPYATAEQSAAPADGAARFRPRESPVGCSMFIVDGVGTVT